MKEILQYLKTHGERLDTEIAEATGISLTKVRLLLSELAVPPGGIYSSRSTGQKIKVTAEAIVTPCHLIHTR
jgi:hypothetical protein